jgi:solute carrier family 66 (lysosomal lysine-arginine transporter), member 1
LFTDLAPTAIVLASYFCCADIVLISQSLYYNTTKARRNHRRQNSVATNASEEEPLLARRRSSSLGLPGSHRRLGTHTESSLEPLRKVITGEDITPDSNPWLHNAVSILAVYLVGATGWYISYRFGAWDPKSGTPDTVEPKEEARIGLFLGYCSALCYLW